MPERYGTISQSSQENKNLSQTDYEVMVIGAGVAGICQIKKLKDTDIQLSMRYRVRSIDHLEEIADFKNILKELKIVINYCI